LLQSFSSSIAAAFVPLQTSNFNKRPAALKIYSRLDTSSEEPSVDITTAAEESSTPSSPFLDASSSNPVVRFGDVVSLRDKPVVNDDGDDDRNLFVTTIESSSSSSSTAAMIVDPSQIKRRNYVVAALSVGLAITNYLWQWTHPITPIQLLYTMEQNSSPITAIGTTSKPTVVDFWAPWYVSLCIIYVYKS
jgi:hypothetical protein